MTTHLDARALQRFLPLRYLTQSAIEAVLLVVHIDDELPIRAAVPGPGRRKPWREYAPISGVESSKEGRQRERRRYALRQLVDFSISALRPNAQEQVEHTGVDQAPERAVVAVEGAERVKQLRCGTRGVETFLVLEAAVCSVDKTVDDASRARASARKFRVRDDDGEQHEVRH